MKKSAKGGLATLGLIVAGGGVLIAATLNVVSAAPWALERIENENRALVLQLRLSGVASGCMGLDKVDVVETSDEVRVTTYVWGKRPWPADPCTAELAYEQARVTLGQPLGNRDLRGCRPETLGGSDNSLCRDQRRAHRDVEW
jgi:hypothetical protein